MAAEEGRCRSCVDNKAFKNTMSTVGIIVSLAVMAVAILGLIFISFNIRAVIFSIYQVIFGIVLVASEFRLKLGLKWFRFTAPYYGLGATYIFIAIFTISEASWWQILVAAVCGAVGCCNIFLGFLGMKRYDYDTEAVDERAAASQYAVSKAQAANTPENRAAAASAASAHMAEEGRGNNANPFENDNPFESNNQYGGQGAYN